MLGKRERGRINPISKVKIFTKGFFYRVLFSFFFFLRMDRLDAFVRENWGLMECENFWIWDININESYSIFTIELKYWG